jgi:hypothetical protein
MHSRFVLFFAFVVIINAQNLTFPDCKSGPLSTFPICDQSLPSHERAADLINRMTTAEKITQLVHKVPRIPRLGLLEIIWWSEALHTSAHLWLRHYLAGLNSTIDHFKKKQLPF